MATHKVLLNVSVNTLCVAFFVLKHKKSPALTENVGT